MTKDMLAGIAALALFAAIVGSVFAAHQRFCLDGDLGFGCQVAKGFIAVLLPTR